MIQRVARALGARSWTDIDLMLETFGFPTSDYNAPSEPYAYVIEMVKRADDADVGLRELDAYLAKGRGAAPDADEETVWRPGDLRLFISHTAAHKKRAARIATLFERVGVHGFVSHDAIEPTREWQDVIEAALLSCDALCAMITPDFIHSRWCDQEVGFAVAQRKLVMPLKMDADPHGFIGKYQAIPSSKDRDTAFEDIEAMLVAMVRHPTTSAKAAPVAVHRYARSRSFDAARTAFKLLQAIPTQAWTPTMIGEVDRANTENGQVREAVLPGGKRVPEAVEELLKELRPDVPPPTPDDDIPF